MSLTTVPPQKTSVVGNDSFGEDFKDVRHERKELHDLTYIWDLRVDYIEAESRNVITFGREMGKMGGKSGEMLVE